MALAKHRSTVFRKEPMVSRIVLWPVACACVAQLTFSICGHSCSQDSTRYSTTSKRNIRKYQLLVALSVPLLCLLLWCGRSNPRRYEVQTMLLAIAEAKANSILLFRGALNPHHRRGSAGNGCVIPVASMSLQLS